MYVCMYVRMYVYVCVHVCVYVCIYFNTTSDASDGMYSIIQWIYLFSKILKIIKNIFQNC